VNNVAVEEIREAYIAGGDGTIVPLTKESFEALQDMWRRKYSGTVMIHFNGGRIAGVEMAVKKVYK
jgi:hypothetical protein